MRTRFAIPAAALVTSIMTIGALSGPASANTQAPTVPRDAKARVAQLPVDSSQQPNVWLTLTVDGKLHFSEKSYKPATATTPARWVHCRLCGKIQGHSLKTLNPYVTLERGNNDQVVTFASYVYQEYDPLTRIFVDRNSAFVTNPHWDGWNQPLDIVAFGPREYIRVMSVGIYDPHKPQAPLKGGDCDPAVFDCGGGMK